MELSIDLGTAERIALGLLTFIALILYPRWQGDHSSARDETLAKPPELVAQS